MPDFAAKLVNERTRMDRLLRQDASESIEREIGDLRAGDVLRNIRKVGERAPSFDLLDIHGRHVHSSDLMRRGAVILSFFRGTWCPYCMLELFEFSQHYATIRELGAEMVAIAPQSAETAETFFSDHPLAFRVLVDAGSRISEAFGVSYEVADYMQPVYRSAFGLNLPYMHKDHKWRLPIPSQFIIDRGGSIVYVRSDPDFRNAVEPTEIIAFLERLRGGPAG